MIIVYKGNYIRMTCGEIGLVLARSHAIITPESANFEF